MNCLANVRHQRDNIRPEIHSENLFRLCSGWIRCFLFSFDQVVAEIDSVFWNFEWKHQHCSPYPFSELCSHVKGTKSEWTRISWRRIDSRLANNAKLENQYACALCLVPNAIANGANGFSFMANGTRHHDCVASRCRGHQLPVTRRLLRFVVSFNRCQAFSRWSFTELPNALMCSNSGITLFLVEFSHRRKSIVNEIMTAEHHYGISLAAEPKERVDPFVKVAKEAKRNEMVTGNVQLHPPTIGKWNCTLCARTPLIHAWTMSACS